MKPELIVALDVDSGEKAKRLVNLLYPKVKIFKVGLQLFTAEGPAIIKWLIKKKAKVFLDLKLYDIPHTLSQTAKVIIRYGVSIFTVHLSAGKEALLEVKDTLYREAKERKIKRPWIIGVTVLTSQKEKDTNLKITELVKLAQEVGLDGVVASVKDVPMIRRHLNKKSLIVCPGIRIEKIKDDDQKRTATLKEAKDLSVDYIVVGRPIIKADDPLYKVEEILREIRCP